MYGNFNLEDNNMNILSLFDGMSCGRIALERAGVDVGTYYASELDKYAIQVSKKNYPDIIHLGDVTKWKEWDIDWSSIDLLIGGSPCQGFSFAGKQLNFEDERSKLFFVYVDILNHIKSVNSTVKFMLENVVMKKEYQDVISERLNVQPVKINSALLTAHNRPRLYWSNIPFKKDIEDKNITISDIIDKDTLLYEYIPDEKTANRRFTPNYLQYDINGKGHGSQDQRAYYLNGKHGCLDTRASGKAKILDKDGRVRKVTRNEGERLQCVPDDYTKYVTKSQALKMLGNGWTVDVIAHIFKGLI